MTCRHVYEMHTSTLDESLSGSASVQLATTASVPAAMLNFIVGCGINNPNYNLN